MNKIAVTLDYLLENTSTVLKQRSKSTSIVSVKQIKNRWIYKIGDYIVRIKLSKIPAVLKRQLTTRAFNKLLKVKNRDIFVSCTCNFWHYNGPDYNAVQQEYSERQFSDLSSPDIRDPNRENLICKHVYKALKHFQSNFKETIM
jgi:hypothetical protein